MPPSYPPPRDAGVYQYRLKDGTHYTGFAYWSFRTIKPTLVYKNSIEAEAIANDNQLAC